MKYDQLPFTPYKETTSGTVQLYINDKLVETGNMENSVPARFSATETMDEGMDLGATVSPNYRINTPFKFTGTIKKVEFETSPTQPTKN